MNRVILDHEWQIIPALSGIRHDTSVYFSFDFSKQSNIYNKIRHANEHVHVNILLEH